MSTSSSSRMRVVLAMGTRPEVLKLAPVLLELRRHPAEFDTHVVATAQHRELLAQALSAFDIRPDVDLELMRNDQTPADFAGRVLPPVSTLLERVAPHVVLVHGDTTTAMAVSLSAAYHQIRVGHVEAGLRSHDRRNPFPEELNRRLIGCMAELHFAPTPRARSNLLAEGVPAETVWVTGNTVVDAVLAVERGGDFEDPALGALPLEGRRVILVTSHRRENHGLRLYAICRAVRAIVRSRPDVAVVFPVHPNPSVRGVVHEELGDVDRVHLLDPVPFADLLRLVQRSHLVLSDSGGLQEEAATLHRPILILRDVTERPEVVEVGAGRLVGTDTARIVEATTQLLAHPADYERMARAPNPIGDGLASSRIATILARELAGRSLPGGERRAFGGTPHALAPDGERPMRRAADRHH